MLVNQSVTYVGELDLDVNHRGYRGRKQDKYDRKRQDR